MKNRHKSGSSTVDNGYANGTSNGHSNGNHSNGHSNGYTNGHSNGSHSTKESNNTTVDLLDGEQMKSVLSHVRAYLFRKREEHQKHILALQKFRHPFLDTYMWLSSTLGEEIFYITFLPALAWLTSPRVCLHMVTIASMNIILGNILKNIFLVPRPAVPPVWTPAGKQHEDHGPPSTHTMNAIGIPLYSVLFAFFDTHLLAHKHSVVTLSLEVSVVLGLLWAISISSSRIYNGYHNVLDVVMGAILSTITSVVFFVYLRHWLDVWVLTYELYVPVMTLIGGVLALMWHPTPKDKTTPAHAESALLAGVFVGTLSGYWLNHHVTGPFFRGEPILAPEYVAMVQLLLQQHPSILHILRVVTGMAVVLVIRLLAKKLFTTLVLAHNNKIDVFVPVKYFTYMSIAFSVVSLAPHVMNWVGLHYPISVVYV